MSALAGRTILITGASGYVGGALAEALAPIDCTVILATRQARPVETPGGRATFRPLTGDPVDAAFWSYAFGQEGVDLVFHLAAQNSVYEAEKDVAADWRANVLPTMRLLEAAAACGRTVDIVAAGTATEAGLTETLPVGPDHVDQPITVYDLHKLTAECYLELFASRGQVRGATLRLANVYGPGRAVGSADRGVLNKLAARAIKGETITVYGDGAEIRDYVYIADVARAFVATAEAMERANGRHFYLASGVAHTLKDAFGMVAALAEQRTGRAVPIRHADWPDGLSAIERRNFVADMRPLTDATGWTPEVSLQDGIGRTLDAFLSGRDG